MTGPVLIIAEAGVNHNGDETLALKLVDAAADAGADVIKFQTFDAAALAAADAPKAAYQKVGDTAASQLEMLKRLELSHAAHIRVAEHCRARGIEFLSTAFDFASLAFLISEIGLKRVKIPSGEITNGPLVRQIAETGLPVILSTGMADMDEIGDALAVLEKGWQGKPPPENKVTVLHCTTDYPAAMKDVNLTAMQTIGAHFDVPVGYSDHTLGTTIALAATALGARVIEKHFTLDRTMDGPDHAASLEPGELADMVRAIRDVEVALGDGIKRPTDIELQNRLVARKSLVAARPIAAGHKLGADDLTAIRPGGGLSPMRYWDLLDTPAVRDYAAGEYLEEPEEKNG